MKKTIRWILIGVCLAIFCVFGYKFFSTARQYKLANEFYETTARTYVTETPKELNTPQQAPPVSDQPDQPQDVITDPEPPTVRAPIAVDFSSLQTENEDVVGWIYCEETPLNYPICQSADNEAYLHTMPDGSHSSSGTIFLDYRVTSDFSGDISIIYGHNMRSGAMFNMVPDYAEQSFYDKHPILYLLTPEQNYIVHLFSGMLTDADGWPYVLSFSDDAEKQAYLDRAIAESSFTPQVQPSVDDNILILSTCSYAYDNARYIVMGTLTPIS